MTFEEIQQIEKESLMPTYGRFAACLEKGKGARAWDLDGKEYIDFTSGIGVNSLGFCDDGVVAAQEAQLQKIQHTSNLYYNSTQVLLAQKLCTLTGFSKAFLCNSGAEANEGAIKLARKYSFDTYGAGRATVMTLKNSFHGRTITTLTATGQDAFHQYFDPFTPGFVYATPDIQSVKDAYDSTVCAILVEGIQGEGGVCPLDPDFVKDLRAFCDERDVLLVFDEVQTGVGRTGTLLCCEQFDIKPDIVTLAKGLGAGLPIGAFLCTDKLATTLGAGMHGTTFGGNPVCCAGALEVLERVSQPDFLKTVQEKGAFVRERLIKMPHVKEVRGMGLMIGIVTDLDAKAVASACVANGLLILTAKTLLRLLPPLNIEQKDLDDGLAILENTLKSI